MGVGKEGGEPKLNTFVSALTYHKSYENRGLIVFTLQVHPPPTLHHHPTPPPSSNPPSSAATGAPPPPATSFIQLPADGSCVSSQSAGAGLWAPADPRALPQLRFYYLTSNSPPLLRTRWILRWGSPTLPQLCSCGALFEPPLIESTKSKARESARAQRQARRKKTRRQRNKTKQNWACGLIIITVSLE